MRIIISLFIFSGALMSCAQDINLNDIPSVVLNTFKTNFPDARDVEWEKHGDDYEVEFDHNQIDHNAYIDAMGELILYKYDIRPSELPEAVKNTIQVDFKDYQIDDAELVEKGGEKLYDVELDSNLADRQVVLTQDGQVTENAYSFID
ncbi:putative membrane protein YkoI [Catalinimonas alkaloidigena]|uniref:PepSY-like domain-containing protein n=1 Tax=Catalinimonas alkaloidigena TaxID=1075417 RepID=UPI00240609E4|nr:PepSY-like domain-containing protein [Catalinimonas alkaloidigena]MDF9801391.1 putative membrane protein YkoI [Catalinimonas alkaloidigena]